MAAVAALTAATALAQCPSKCGEKAPSKCESCGCTAETKKADCKCDKCACCKKTAATEKKSACGN